MSSLSSDPLMDRLRQSMMDCRAERCNGLGDCVTVNGLPACNCMLGYRGVTCRETVNGGLSVPLTLGCLGVLCGLILLAFLFSYFRQKRKAKIRSQSDDGKNSVKKNGGFLSFPHRETDV